jgi:hypothetical protein
MEMHTHTLINHYLAGTATDEEIRELDQLLQENEAARHAILKESWMDGALFKVCGGKRSKPIEPVELPIETQKAIEAEDEFWTHTASANVRPMQRQWFAQPSRIAAILLGAVLVGAMAVGGYFATLPQKIAKVTVNEAATFAIGQSWTAGDILRAGDRVELRSGRLTLRFERGALVDLQGPASLVVNDDNSGYLLSGRLVATVPPSGRGFTIQTDQLNAIDYGTVFGVNAKADGQVEVHVFAGEVEAKIPAKDKKGNASATSYRLTRQQALHVTDTGRAQRTLASKSAFGQVARWHTKGLRSLALHSTFENRTYTIRLDGPSVKWISPSRYRGATPVQGENYALAKSDVSDDRTDHYWLLIEDLIDKNGNPAGDLDFDDVQIEVRTQKHDGYDLVTLRLFRGVTSVDSRLIDESGSDLLGGPIPHDPDATTYQFKVPRTKSSTSKTR